MPRIVTDDEKMTAIDLMLNGTPQREIEKMTGLSRPYIRKLSREVGHVFPRNGIEVVGNICMCANCGSFFRRPLSKITNKKHQFCDRYCKDIYFAGPNHPSWKHGKTAETFSKWAVNQSDYKRWREDSLKRAGYQCEISGRIDNLDCHHLVMKSEDPSKVFDPNNSMVLNKEIHNELHQMMSKGIGAEEAIDELRKKYKNDNRKA
jgi:hypothetical protein